MTRENDIRRRCFLKWMGGVTGYAAAGAPAWLPATASAARPRAREDAAAQQKPDRHAGKAPIVLENDRCRLAIGADGRPVSLRHKPSGQECLRQETITPLCTISFLRREGLEARFQEHRGDHLRRCEKNAEHTLFSSRVERDGDRLVVGFEGVEDTLVLRVALTDSYMGFTVEALRPGKGLDTGTVARFREMTFLQLPVRERARFGDWLNVMWDDAVAVNLLAADPRTHIDAERRTGFRAMRARGHAEVALEGLSAALIVSAPADLLDCIDRVERDYGLPRGVESRRRKEYTCSYYWAKRITPQNVAEHIRYAKQGGFRRMDLSYIAFTKGAGHWAWNSRYPNGIVDLKTVVDAIKSAGLTPGLHTHYNKAVKSDPYVSGTPHPGLNLRRIFTLARSVSPEDTTVTVEENPRGVVRDEGRRILRLGNELVQYQDYTTTPPYRFTGCERGHLETTPASHARGLKMGVLDVDSWNKFVRFDQRTSLPDEVARRIASIYNDAGFENIYYDGAEDVHPPDWYHTAAAPLKIHERLDPPPRVAEGASFSHFSWHLLTRANPWDTQRYAPHDLKAGIREDSVAEGPRMWENFSAFTFVRLGYRVGDKDHLGTQPDMIEYACSRGAAWGCPVSLWTVLTALQNHARTPDNLDVFRRWETARHTGWLTQRQREALRDPDQEHILLRDEKGRFEVQPYGQIPGVAGKEAGPVRAFLFLRDHTHYVVFWHTWGEGRVKVSLPTQQVRLLEEIGGPQTPIEGNDATITLPVAGRRYLEVRERSREAIEKAFQGARLLT